MEKQIFWLKQVSRSLTEKYYLKNIIKMIIVTIFIGKFK